MKKLILENRTQTKALAKTQFISEEMFQSWKNSVETLRIKTSAYAICNRQDADATTVLSELYEAYKRILSAFTNKALGEKLKAQSSDINSLLTFCGTNRKTKDSENGKQFLPISANIFRKSLEDFIADRLTNASFKSAEQIETERVERNKANALARKAKKLAEKLAQTTSK